MRIEYLDDKGAAGVSMAYSRTGTAPSIEHDERGHKTFITYEAETLNGERIRVTHNRADIVQLLADFSSDE